MITHEHLITALTYAEFDTLLHFLLTNNRTTGSNQTPEFVDYGKINLQRMNRVYKTTALTADMKAALQKLSRKVVFVVITEGWCGDSAQIVPVFEHMAENCSNIELKFLLRDEHLDIMDLYLTKGARSIPKLVCVDSNSLDVLFTWGPRPAALQAEVVRLIEAHVSKEEKGIFVQKWYNENKTQAIQQELSQLLVSL
jgi:thioredoxin-like negative regulator of GroEL